MRAQVMRMVERMAIAVVVMMMALELAAPMTAMAATPDQTAAERAIATQVSQMAGATDVQTRMAALQAIYPEGNYNVSVHWGRTISRSSMNGQITYILRRDL